eukprot:6186725-Pleurochrysis_carterae.AAC.5
MQAAKRQAERAPAADDEKHTCSACKAALPTSAFNRTQLSKGPEKQRCQQCVAASEQESQAAVEERCGARCCSYKSAAAEYCREHELVLATYSRCCIAPTLRQRKKACTGAAKSFIGSQGEHAFLPHQQHALRRHSCWVWPLVSLNVFSNLARPCIHWVYPIDHRE